VIDAVVKEIRVAATPEKALERFTSEINKWWPRATHSVSQDRCRTVSFNGPLGAALQEVDEDGNRHVWGRFTAWKPPTRVAMTWHPGGDPDTAQQIELTFEADGDETLVTLEHGNFEALGDTALQVRARYEIGWSAVLEKYRESLS
jgi:uncharacterized protein YndB with AHSA1/START domain